MKEIKNNIYQKSFAEFIGTFAMLFFGCGSIIFLTPFLVPIVFGAIIAIMIYTFGHISGAHFNPAVTLAFAATRHFPLKELPFYWGAQFSGGIAAILVLSILYPDTANFGSTLPSVSNEIAFLWEVILSFFLMLVIIAVATDTRAEGTMAGIAIGGIVTICAFVGGQFSGASMNPARSLAPALFEGNYQALWIYLSAPFIGACLGAFVYQKIRCEDHTKGCC